jgi:uncharacterized membrane protein YfcA
LVRAAHRLPVQTLKKIFAVMLYCLAAYMLYKGVWVAAVARRCAACPVLR